MDRLDFSAPQRAEFDRLVRAYSWDLQGEEARAWPFRLFRRVMDLGTLADVVAMERCFGRDQLAEALTTAPIGALRPKSWAWWHLRLGLTEPGEAPPAMPDRRVA